MLGSLGARLGEVLQRAPVSVSFKASAVKLMHEEAAARLGPIVQISRIGSAHARIAVCGGEERVEFGRRLA